MAVSKAVVPMLQGEAARSFVRTLNTARIKQYTQEERERTSAFMQEKLRERRSNAGAERRTN